MGTVSFTPGAANCLPLSDYTVTASPGGAHASGSGSPITVHGLTDATSYTFTYTVTADSADGKTGTATIHYTVMPSNKFVIGHVVTHSNGVVTVRVTVPAAGKVDVLETAWLSNLAKAAKLLQPAAGRFVFSRAHVNATRAGTIQLTVKPNARGKRLLAHHRYRIVIRLWVTFTPTGGQSRSLGMYGLHLKR